MTLCGGLGIIHTDGRYVSGHGGAMRQAKKGAIRRQEFLDAALALFQRQGYERTTLNDILDRVGVSKGAFYHYFAAKEDVLEALALREVERKLEITRAIVADPALTALDKLNRIIARSKEHNLAHLGERLQLFAATEAGENLKLRERMQRESVRLGAPLLQKLIEQGVAEGAMRVRFPAEAARFYLEMMNAFKQDLGRALLAGGDGPGSRESIRRSLLFHQEMLEKSLGVEEGGIAFAAVMGDSLETQGGGE